MNFQPGNLYHIFNQGNDKQPIFNNHEDYVLFLNMTRNLIKPYCDIIPYCLMPNHFHFMIATDERCTEYIQQGGNLLDVLTNGFRKQLSGYARIFNKTNDKTGSLFRPKTKAKIITVPETPVSNLLSINEYYANCFYYIHLNPFAARLVTKAEDWPYSSCKDYAMLRNGTLVNIDAAIKFCDYKPQYFLQEMYGRKDMTFR